MSRINDWHDLSILVPLFLTISTVLSMINFMLSQVSMKKVLYSQRTGPRVIKLFSCIFLQSMKFKLLINTEIAKINGDFRFKSPKPVIYLYTHKFEMHFNIYEQAKFHAQLSEHEKFYNLGDQVSLSAFLEPTLLTPYNQLFFSSFTM